LDACKKRPFPETLPGPVQGVEFGDARFLCLASKVNIYNLKGFIYSATKLAMTLIVPAGGICKRFFSGKKRTARIYGRSGDLAADISSA